jgi:sorting and assembly machinery component 37
MTLQLHVWGPAFGLPSIEPQCIAAIAYVGHVVPRDQWTLVASDPLANPTRECALVSARR